MREKSNFAEKMKKHLQKRKQKDVSNVNYLNLPKGLDIFRVDEDVKKLKIDILLYKVTDKNHPDADFNEGVAVENSLWYRRPIDIHQGVGINNLSFVCPSMFGKKCPICEYRKKRIDEGADKEEFKKYYPQHRSIYLIIPRAFYSKSNDRWESYKEDHLYIWNISNKNFQDELEAALEDSPENYSFACYKGGKTLVLSLKWEKLGKTTFPVVKHIEFVDREDYDENEADKLPSLDNIFNIPSYDELKAKFFEIDDTEVNENVEPVEDDEIVAPAITRLTKSVEYESVEPKKMVRNIKVDEDEDEDALPFVKDENEPPFAKPTKVETKGKCPFGFKFGDYGKHDECDSDCDVWEECIKFKKRSK